MITLIHILIAIASVGYVAALLIRPTLSQTIAHLSVGATLVSGVLLMIVQPSTIPHVCVSGSVYLVAASLAIVLARSRRAKMALVES